MTSSGVAPPAPRSAAIARSAATSAWRWVAVSRTARTCGGRLVQEVVDRVGDAPAGRGEQAEGAQRRHDAAGGAGRGGAQGVGGRRQQHPDLRQRGRDRVDPGRRRDVRGLHDPALARDPERARLVQRQQGAGGRSAGAAAERQREVEAQAPQLVLGPQPGRATRVRAAGQPRAAAPERDVHGERAVLQERERAGVAHAQPGDVDLREPVDRHVARGRRAGGHGDAYGHAQRLRSARGRGSGARLVAQRQAGGDDRGLRAPHGGLVDDAEHGGHGQARARCIGQRRRRCQLAGRVVEVEQGDEPLDQAAAAAQVGIVAAVLAARGDQPGEQAQGVGGGLRVEDREGDRAVRRAQRDDVGDRGGGVRRPARGVASGRVGDHDEAAGQARERVEHAAQALGLALDAVGVAARQPRGLAARRARRTTRPPRRPAA